MNFCKKIKRFFYLSFFISSFFSNSHSNSHNFQSSNNKIINHNIIQIKLPTNGLFGKKYKSSKFAIPLQIMTIAANIKKIFMFDLLFLLNFLIAFNILCILFNIQILINVKIYLIYIVYSNFFKMQKIGKIFIFHYNYILHFQS